MKSRITVRFVCAVAVLACMAIAGPLFAVGGIYVDSIQINVNNSAVFMEDFNGTLSGWTSLRDAVIASGPGGRSSLHLNRHGTTSATAFRSLQVRETGVIEMNAVVWMPPTNEQYDWLNKSNSGYANFQLRSGNNKDNITAAIRLNSQDTSYRVYLAWTGVGAPGITTSVTSWTDTAVMPAQKWLKLTIRLDPNTGLASLLIDGKQTINVFYKPENFPGLKGIHLMSFFGDGSDLPVAVR